MKSSGVDWIGNIPAHWEVKRLKDLFNIISGSTPSPSEIDIDAPIKWVTPTDFNDMTRRLEKTSRHITQKGLSQIGSFQAKDNDLIISCRAPAGKVAILKNGLFSFNQGCKVLTQKKYLDNVYFFYALVSARKEIENYSRGTTFLEISSGNLSKLKFVFPSQEEQRAIASFLDDRTSAIDSKIEALKEKEDSLAQLRKSIIHEAVTKGLSKSQLFFMLERFSNLPELVAAYKKNYEHLPVKKSGLSLIGDVPMNWNIKRLKDVVSIPITDGPHETPVLLESGYPFISVESITNGKIDLSKKRGFISEKDYQRYSVKYKPQRDDILFVKSASVGKVSIVDTDEPFQVWSPLAAIRCNKKNVPKFIYFVMASSYFQESVLNGSSLNTQYNIGMKKLGNVPIALPPLYEQHAIAHYLDEQTTIIDQSIDTVKKEIEALQELRKSLIHEAVTGKLDVADFGYNY